MTDLSQMSTEQLLALYGQQAPAEASGSVPIDPLKPPPAPLTEAQLAAYGQRRQQGDQPLAWSDVPGQMVSNFIPSATQFGADIYNTFAHPIETLTNIGNVGSGVAQKLGLKSGEEDIPYADAVGQFYKERYGSLEGFKRALAQDPVGVSADLSTALSGGSLALAKAPGVAGTVGRVAGAVSTATDPIRAPVALAGVAAKKVALPALSGVSGDVIEAAQTAARTGGARSESARDFMRGAGDIEDIAGDAHKALDQMRVQRQQAYRADMKALAKDRTVLDFTDIDKSVGRMSDVGTFKGVEWQRSARPIRDMIINEIDYWKSLDPALYHTPEGMDALKKSIGDIGNRVGLENKAGRLVVKEAVDAVKATIEAQSPGYAKTMKAYHNASNALDNMRSTFSLNDPAKTDSALRKLTSAMRNNVNTNFGQRAKMLDELDKLQPGLKDKIAGATLNTWTPRGLSGAVLSNTLTQAIPAALTGGFGGLAALPFQIAASSPRVIGEGARLTGLAQRYGGRFVPTGAEAARQAGRTEPKRLYIDTTEWGR